MRQGTSRRRKLRALVVGTRRRGLDHLRVLSQLHDAFTVVGACDADPRLATLAATTFGVNGYASLERALAKARPEVVVLAVHHELTLGFVATVAPRGIHLLVETPVAPTVAICDLIIDFARRHGVQIEVAENIYRRPTERIKQAIVASGRLGPVSRVINFRRWQGTHAMSLLRTHARLAPREVTAFAAPFPLDCETNDQWHEEWEHARFLFGDSIVATSEHLAPRAAHRRPQGQFFIECAGGAIADACVLAQPRPSRWSAEISSRGVIERLNWKRGLVEWRNPFARYGLADEDDVAIADELLSLRRAILEDAEPDYGLTNARADLELLMASGQSARALMTVLLPLGAPTDHEEHRHMRLERKWGRHPLDTSGLDAPLENWH